jgi:hypothetical protein
MASPPPRAVNLGLQMARIKAVLPEAEVTVRRGELVCIAFLQPNAMCRRYTARIVYRHRHRPRVTIIDPPLELAPGAEALPHVYEDGELCLYLPGEWQESRLLADTILPWTSEWLLHYEWWLVTGHWSGSGHDYPVPHAANELESLDPALLVADANSEINPREV